jgi:hypothetical protein
MSAQIHDQATFSPGKERHYPLDRRVGGDADLL